MTMQSRIRDIHSRLQKLTERLSFLAPALIRLTVGLVFIRTGWGKLHTLDDVTELFTNLHIPLPALNARIASFTEFAGGIFILTGLGARLAALPLSFTMLVAIVSARLGDVNGFVDFLALEEWSYLVMFLVIALRGAGPLSLDAWLSRRFARQHAEGLPRPLLRPQEVKTSAA